MKPFISSLALVFFLAGCAGGFPPTSSNGLSAFDIIFGLKEIPQGADKSRVWSPVHQIYGGKPDWSVVWFKEKTKDGKPYELTATPSGQGGAQQAKVQPEQAPERASDPVDQLTETASLVFGEIKSWINKVIPQ